MYLFYRTLTLLLAPLALWRLGGRWRERLGYMEPMASGSIWIHAASVGEVNAGSPLIRRLLERDSPIIVSTVTVTGAARVGQLFGDKVTHRFLPLDTRGSVRRWLEQVRPRAVLVLETEIWPVLFETIAHFGLRPAMINARLSEKSMRRYRFVRRTVAAALGHAGLIACQTGADAERFRVLGADPAHIRVTGNLKFDIELPQDVAAYADRLRDAWSNRPVWVAGSTHAGEEETLLAVHAGIRESLPDVLLVLAPRHPERAASLARGIERAGLPFVRLGQAVAADTAVVLVDRVGALMACYMAADVAFVGGSLVEVGGHNLLEPARLKRPVISGPYLETQREVADSMQKAGALIRVDDAAALQSILPALFRDNARRAALGAAAYRFVESGRGALESTLAAIEPILPPGTRNGPGGGVSSIATAR